MTLEADRMENLVLTNEIIIPERDVVQGRTKRTYRKQSGLAAA